MNEILQKLRNARGENSVTIILNTHRTRPDNEKDTILLKNLVREASDRLLANNPKRAVNEILARLKDLEEKIDHSKNLDSLVLFVNGDHSDYVRLPIRVTDRVIIDSSFAMRDLIRSLHMQTSYYVLVLSQEKARLIAAVNDQVAEEDDNFFPFENDQWIMTSRAEQANASKKRKMTGEFFNRIDKAIVDKRKKEKWPVLICTEEGNYYEYLKMADEKSAYFPVFLNKNRLDEESHAIVTDAWSMVAEQVRKTSLERKDELAKAIGAKKYISDPEEIYTATKEGRISTLFIEEGLFQPGFITNGRLVLHPGSECENCLPVDDIYEELIEQNINFGGEMVFLPKGELSQFNGFAAITRY